MSDERFHERRRLSHIEPNRPLEGDRPDPREHRPKVILDIEFERGMLFIAMSNIGGESALKVTTKLDRRIMGLGGRKDMNNLKIFKGVQFFAPGKEVRFLLDSAHSYYSRRQPTKFTAEISYSDVSGKKYKENITHDLAIYKDLPYVTNLLEDEHSSRSSARHP
jgi:hypothetical protein